jgi:hypothetical protein
MSTNIVITQGAVLAGCRIGPLWIGATGSRPIDDASWAEYLGLLERDVRRSGPVAVALQWAPTHVPNAGQRKLLSDRGDALRLDDQHRVALISDDAFARRVITVLSWLRQSIELRAYARHDAGVALEWLGQVATFDRSEADRKLLELVKVVSAPAMARAAGAR